MKPQPLTYAERLRGLMSWMLFGAGVVCTAMSVGIILIVWIGGWPVGTEHDRLRILSWQALGAMGGMMSVIVSLAIGGPVGRFKVGATRNGVDVEANGRDEMPAAPVVTTTTTVTPPPAGGKP